MYTAKSLKIGKTYEFRLAAFNSAGMSGYVQSDPVSARDVVRAPNSPNYLRTFLEISQKHISLTWEAPEFDGGSQLISYIIEQYDSQSKRWQSIGERPSHTKTFRVSYSEL